MYLEKPLLECRYNHMLIICSFLRSLLPLLIPVVFFFFFFFFAELIWLSDASLRSYRDAFAWT